MLLGVVFSITFIINILPTEYTEPLKKILLLYLTISPQDFIGLILILSKIFSNENFDTQK